MAYAAQNDLNIDTDRLIELTDSGAAPGVVDTVLLARLEAQSEAIVNAQLGGTATVPFTAPIPPIIVFITASIWAYRIYRHREVMDIPATIQDDYKLAWDMMAQIVAGTIDLDPTDATLSGVPEVQSSASRGWTPRDLVS